MDKRAALADLDPEILLADGFDDALIGSVDVWMPNGQRCTLALYDREKAVQILISNGMSHPEALEFHHFNQAGAFMGPLTPAWADLFEHRS